jgi:Uma2 family endonuclease
MMGVPTIDTGPMTIEDFLAFTGSRPEEERWELIDGEPVLNASASLIHQRVLRNLLHLLTAAEWKAPVDWTVLPGVNLIVSPVNAPVPDVMVRPRDELRDWKCNDAIIAFEVLSPSTRLIDLQWKLKAYTSLPSVQSYVVLAQDAADIAVFERELGFEERRVTGLDATLALTAIDIQLALSDIYRDCGF